MWKSLIKLVSTSRQDNVEQTHVIFENYEAITFETEKISVWTSFNIQILMAIVVPKKVQGMERLKKSFLSTS